MISPTWISWHIYGKSVVFLDLVFSGQFYRKLATFHGFSHGISQQSMDLARVARRARPSITSPRLPPSYAATACWTSPFRRIPRWKHVPMGLWMEVFPWVFPWVSVKNGENSEFWLAERVNVARFRAMFDYQRLVGIDRVLRNPSKQVSVLIWKHGNQKNCLGYFTRILQDPGLICLGAPWDAHETSWNMCWNRGVVGSWLA